MSAQRISAKPCFLLPTERSANLLPRAGTGWAPDPGWAPQISSEDLGISPDLDVQQVPSRLEWSFHLLLPVPTMIQAPLTLLTIAVQVQVAEVGLKLRPNHDLLQRQRPRKVRAYGRLSHHPEPRAVSLCYLPTNAKS